MAPTRSTAPTTTSPFSDESPSGALAAPRPQRHPHGSRPGAPRSAPCRRRWRIRPVIKLDGATVLLQWAAGGWLFLWVTTRRREVGLGYGWLQRLTFLGLGVLSLAAAFLPSPTWEREIMTMAFMAAGLSCGEARPAHGVRVGWRCC